MTRIKLGLLAVAIFGAVAAFASKSEARDEVTCSQLEASGFKCADTDIEQPMCCFDEVSNTYLDGPQIPL